MVVVVVEVDVDITVDVDCVDVVGAVVGEDTSEVVIVDVTAAVEDVVIVPVEDTALKEEDSGKANQLNCVF